MAAAFAAAAQGLDVCLIEKDICVGGSTSLSGGVLWAPGHGVTRHDDAEAAAESALTYLTAEAGNHLDRTMAQRFLGEVPRVIAFLVKEARLDLTAPVYPDYHPGLPGWSASGRALRPRPFDGRQLGPALGLIRMPLPSMTLFGGMMVSAEDLGPLTRAHTSLSAAAHAAQLIGRYALDRLVHGRATRLTNGNALVGQLLHAVIARGVFPHVGVALDHLILEHGRVIGAELLDASQRRQIRVRRGVILATGGIVHNKPLLSRLGVAQTPRPLPPLSSSGDGARIACAAGASLRREAVSAVAFVPISEVPGPSGTTNHPSFFDRSKPGFLIVSADGRRFANEALSYHDLGPLIAAREDDGVFLIGDDKAVRAYGIGAALPWPFSNRALLRSGYLIRAGSISALAQRLNVDAEALRQTITAWNRTARDGTDPALGRGSDAYQRHIGDPAHRPNPSIGPLTKAPFYAVRLRAGFISTFVGLRVGPNAQVLRDDGTLIGGLHAVGNDMASVMGGTYPGPGITLAPALVFGVLAAEALADLTPDP